jgi:glycosyltransferase involved in cell wall biosynthesis
MLLTAWQAAEDELISTGASLVIAGPESNTDRIVRWRAGLRNPQRVHLAGDLHPNIVPAYIRSSDVVLLPSMEEGLPNVAMEASACGRPVFGSEVGGIPEVVIDGETGLLLPAGNVRAWKDALIAYARQVPRLRAMGRRARCRMEELFDSRYYAPKMLDLYYAALREPLI